MTDLSKTTIAELIAELRRQRDEINTALAEFGDASSVIAQIVAAEYKLRILDIYAQNRTPHIALARWVAMTLIHESGRSYVETAAVFGLTHGAASYAHRKIALLEDQDSNFASRLQDLRTQIAAALNTTEISQTSVQPPVSAS